MGKEKKDAGLRDQKTKKKKFMDFFLSFKPNGYIGCLEYVILSVAGMLVSAFMFVMWGAGIFAMLIPSLFYGNSGPAFSAFPFIMGIISLMSLALALFAIAAYHARLLQLRLIDIGLGSNLSVPAMASNFWCCFAAIIVTSLFSILALLLFIFCCVWQGKTYKDNRDLFATIGSMPAKEELVRQMREEK